MSKRERKHSVFSKTLNALMAEKELGVREAARLAGVNPSTIVSWRSGALPEDYLAVRRLAQGLGVSFSYLLTGEDDTRFEGTAPAISEVFEDGGTLFDGFAKITIQRLIPKSTTGKEGL